VELSPCGWSDGDALRDTATTSGRSDPCEIAHETVGNRTIRSEEPRIADGVLLAPGLFEPERENPMVKLRRLLVPIDDTSLSDRVLDHALTLAERFGSHLHVLYVRHETRPTTIDAQARDEEEFDAEHDAVRAAAVRMLRQGHTLPQDHIHAEVRTGDVLQCVLDAAEEAAVDLIVMGTHGRQGLSDTLLGSTTERVVARARQAVWVVRDVEPEA
jgi:nucleotide-binding universal stress UspA family protein